MRGRVNLVYNSNEDARRATYLRRKKGLLKKLKELTILSGGIDACALIYSEFDDQPEKWPSSPSELQRIITKFRSYPELEQGKKMLNQESLLDELILKANEKLAKRERKNREIQMSLRMFELLTNENIIQTMSKYDLNQLAWTIDEKLKQVDQRIVDLNNNASTSQSHAQTTDGAIRQGEAQAQVVDPTLVAANGAIMQGEAQAQVADPTLVENGAIMQGEAQAQVADGASMQAEAHVNHGQSDEMNKKATQDFSSFLKHINGGDNDSSA
ncbi:agamous-like MADS-box protein AGL80 [Lotus japonicus]|uniref:agamous-like MADS-box protein AGL80 n=1 Tax=Lotus japonicus TaxID=34305 RepID=UPI00258E6984|nr:agamous-like MADS-box protein AGL80 [Lotus japonicus]